MAITKGVDICWINATCYRDIRTKEKKRAYRGANNVWAKQETQVENSSTHILLGFNPEQSKQCCNFL